MLKTSTTLIVEPNEFVREGLRSCLAETAYDVIAVVQTIAPGQLPEAFPHPELVILGPGASENLSAELGGLRALARPEKKFRSVLILDLVAEIGIERFEMSGFDALLSKDVTSEVLVRSLELVMLGQQIFPRSKQPRSSPSLMATMREMRSRESSAYWGTRADIALSEREIQALRGLTAGESNKVMAQRLFVSEATIKARVKSLLRKIGAANRTQAALWAIQNPEISNDSPETRHVGAENQAPSV